MVDRRGSGEVHHDDGLDFYRGFWHCLVIEAVAVGVAWYAWSVIRPLL